MVSHAIEAACLQPHMGMLLVQGMVQCDAVPPCRSGCSAALLQLQALPETRLRCSDVGLQSAQLFALLLHPSAGSCAVCL